MNLGTEDKKKLGILVVVGVFALGAGYYMYTELFPPDAPPAAAPVVTTVAPVKTTTGAAKQTMASGNAVGMSRQHEAGDAPLDPTLHPEAMLVTESLVYSGSGRNIFSASSVPVGEETSKAIARVRTPQVIAPVRTGPVGPPPPPPVDLKFFGTSTAEDGKRQAFLLHQDDVFIASPGDIVQRRYRIISIDARSIVIEDIPNNNRQTLPLLGN